VSVEPILLGFAVIVFLGYGAETVTGFGSTLICVTLGAHLLPIHEVLTLAVPLSLLQAGYIAVRHASGIRWRLFWLQIIPLMGAGTAVGMVIRDDLGGVWVRAVFAVLVLLLATRELWLLRRARTTLRTASRPLPAAASVSAMVGAGVIHGIYATGGPMLVYAVGRSGLDKHQFRSTLAAVWLALNFALVTGYVLEGRYDARVGTDLLILLPAIPLGIVAGEYLHRRVDERRFKTIVFALLIPAAISLLLP
jgi:uncharacterized protein